MILEILLRNKAVAIDAGVYRIQHKVPWATGETEFNYLLEALSAGL